MPRIIRVLVVDDSYFMRKLIRELISTETDIEIVGEATNGFDAIKASKDLSPDVITMDFNMPQMNGAEATLEIKSTQPSPPAIIMLSARTLEGAAETLECLRAGAMDFVAKPSGELSIDLEGVKQELVGKIRLAAEYQPKKPIIFSKKDRVYSSERKNAKKTADIIAIGASTGGPPTLEDILIKLPAQINSGLLVVQHMPEKFTKSLAERLDKIIELKTKEAEEGETIKNNVCLIAPGGWHMLVEARQEKELSQRTIHLNKEPPIFGLRPAIDITFSSVASHYKERAVGIILTGMGSDGTNGARAIKEAGGYIIAQSPETAIIDSMPKSVIKNGLADEILSPEEIAERIKELAG